MTSSLGAAPVRHTHAVRRPCASLAGRALDSAGAMPVNSMLSVVGVAGAVAAVGAVGGGVRRGAAAGVVGAAALAATWPVASPGRSGFERARVMVRHRCGPKLYCAPPRSSAAGRETASERLARVEFERAVSVLRERPRDGGRS